MISSHKPDSPLTEEQIVALQHAHEVLQVFLAEITHEIRTPLSTVIGFTEILLAGKAGSLNEKQTEYLTYVLKSSEQLAEVFEYLLDMNRAVFHRLNLNIEEVDFSQLIQQSLSDKIQFHIAAGLPSIWADRHRVKQAVTAILSEATAPIYDGEEGKTSATVSYDDTWLKFNVITEGKAFYFRNYPNPELFLSQAIIEAHGGQMQVEKREERKFEIMFTLPIYQNKPAVSQDTTVE
jgi:signal transduction histidine kinase